jgi:hypothetical protein
MMSIQTLERHKEFIKICGIYNRKNHKYITNLSYKILVQIAMRNIEYLVQLNSDLGSWFYKSLIFIFYVSK